MPLPRRFRDLSSFELLLSVAQLGSIGQAAAAHGISQPAASTRLRALERELGLSLLDRRPRGTRLTTNGELVAGWALPVLDRAADLEAGIAALVVDTERHLTVAATLTVAEYLLPPWLIALKAVHPDTVVALVCENSTEVANRVLARTADLGFVEGPTLPAGVRACDVGSDELAVVVSPSHRWAHRSGAVDLAEVAATSLVSREPDSGTRQAWERALRDHLAAAPAPAVLEVSSTTAIKAAAMGGIGPAVLSTKAVGAELAAGTLVRVEVSGVDLRRRFHAIWAEDIRLRGPASDLVAIALRA